MLLLIAQAPLPMPEKMPENFNQAMVWIVVALISAAIIGLGMMLKNQMASQAADRTDLKSFVQDLQKESKEARLDFTDSLTKAREMHSTVINTILNDNAVRLDKVCGTFTKGIEDLSIKIREHGCRHDGRQ